MTDSNDEPFGAEQLPRAQPTPNPTNPADPASFRPGTPNRWLIPAAVLGVIAVMLFVIAIQLEPVLAIIGIVVAIGMWLAMLLVSRRQSDAKRRNRLLAWLMGAMAAAILLILLVIYTIESWAPFTG